VVGSARAGDGSVEADVAQQMVIEAAQRFELMAAGLRRGTDVEHRFAHQPANEKKDEAHADKVAALP
jgi:hypothetical protein